MKRGDGVQYSHLDSNFIASLTTLAAPGSAYAALAGLLGLEISAIVVETFSGLSFNARSA